MRAHPFGFGFSLLVFVATFCHADDQTVDVVGAADCADCLQNNFRTSHAFSGLHVTIDCKLKNGEIKRVGDTVLDEGGEFKLSLLKEIIHDGEALKKECYAQLHNAAAAPCPTHDGLDLTKIIVKSQIHNKITLAPAKTLRFSTALCTSKFLWPFFKYPPLPKIDPWKKKWPKITIPHLKSYGHPWLLKPKPKTLPPLLPVYKPKPKLLPPPLPIYKPKPKLLPPPLPIYKPKPKPPVVIVKPLPPIYKPKPKPKPPIVKPKPLPPIYKPKPKPPVVKPLPPIYKPKPKPPIVKPLPPIYKPIHKPPVVKPLPPIYKPKPEPSVPIYKPPVFPIPPLHKKPCPPFTKIPPKFKFKHHKFGHYFPKAPFIPIHP